MEKSPSWNKVYPTIQSKPIHNPELDEICREFFSNFELEARFYNKQLSDLRKDIPSEYYGVYDSFLSTVYTLPIINFIDHLKNCLYKTDEEIEIILNENFSSFKFDGFPTGPLLESLEFLFSFNTKFTLTEFLLKFHQFFEFLNRNLDHREEILNICLSYFNRVIKIETLSSKFKAAICSIDEFEYFYKNKVFYFYFDCLNTLLLNGYPELENLNLQFFPKDKDMYVSLLEFIFDLDKDIDMGIAEFLYKIVSFYEIDHQFKLDLDTINRLVLSSKTIDFMMLIEILRYQDSQVDLPYCSLVFRSTIESIKYKNPYLYVLASRLILKGGKYYETFQDIFYLNSNEVVDHIAENACFLPFLLQEKAIKDIFLNPAHDFAQIVDFSVFKLCELKNRDKFIQILTYHFRKKNIRPVSFLIFLALDLESDNLLAKFLDYILDYLNPSKSGFKKFTTFLNFIYQEYTQIGSSSFGLASNEFLKSAHLYSDIDSFMKDYRVFYLKKSDYKINYDDLRVISIDKSLTSQRVLTIARNLLMQNASESLVSSLFTANTCSYNGSFLEFKYPFGVPADCFAYSGPQVESSGITLSIGNTMDSLLNIGKSPVETCLAYDQPLTSKFLVSYIIEPSVSCWYFHKDDRLIARRVMVLAEMESQPVFLAMPLYSLEKDQDFLVVADILTRYMCNENGFDLIVYDQGESHPAGTKIERSSKSMDYEITIDFIRSGCFKFDFLKKDIITNYNPATSSYRLTSSIQGYLFEVED